MTVDSDFSFQDYPLAMPGDLNLLGQALFILVHHRRPGSAEPLASLGVSHSTISSLPEK